MRPSIFNPFIYFFLPSVKFRAFVGALGWAAAQAEAGWDAQETPSAHFLFRIVAEKGRTLNRSALSFLSSKPMGQLTSADMWKSYFVLIRFHHSSSHRHVSHTSAGQENVSLFFYTVFSLWLLPVRIHSPPSDRQQHVFVTAHTVWNTSAHPFSSSLSKHTCAGKQAVH